MKAVDRSSLMHVWHLITKLEALGVVLPGIAPHGLVGDIALLWENNDYYLEVTTNTLGAYTTYTNTTGNLNSVFVGNLNIEAFDAAFVSTYLSDFKAIPDSIRAQIAELETFRGCMSYSDSYFGEPDGFVKRLTRNINFWLHPQVKPSDEKDPNEKGT